MFVEANGSGRAYHRPMRWVVVLVALVSLVGCGGKAVIDAPRSQCVVWCDCVAAIDCLAASHQACLDECAWIEDEGSPCGRASTAFFACQASNGELTCVDGGVVWGAGCDAELDALTAACGPAG